MTETEILKAEIEQLKFEIQTLREFARRESIATIAREQLILKEIKKLHKF